MDDRKMVREHRKHDAIFWIGLILLGLMAVNCTGCTTTPLTEDQIYERENREVLRLEKFYRDEANCVANGGMIRITRHGWLPRRCMMVACPPRRGERVECVGR